MKQHTKAFAPGNISCFFKIVEDTQEKMSSLGLGFTINEGVTVTVSQSTTTEVFFNGKVITFPTVISVVKRLTQEQVSVNIETIVPLGGGFGISGASALATAYAVNDLFALKHDLLVLAKIAHSAEVENKTGLGDVTNQYFGGCLLKLHPSSEFIVERISVVNTPIYCRFFSKLSTESILTNKHAKDRIDYAGTQAQEKITRLTDADKQIKLAEILSISKTFAYESGLLTDELVKTTIQEIENKGGYASMIMLGNAVISTIEFEGSEVFYISQQPAHMLF